MVRIFAEALTWTERHKICTKTISYVYKNYIINMYSVKYHSVDSPWVTNFLCCKSWTRLRFDWRKSLLSCVAVLIFSKIIVKYILCKSQNKRRMLWSCSSNLKGAAGFLSKTDLPWCRLRASSRCFRICSFSLSFCPMPVLSILTSFNGTGS